MGKTVARTGKILFELPIYRVSREVHSKEFQKYRKKYRQSSPDPKVEEMLNMNLKKEFGGDWEYNEIVGYLEFYIICDQIRCAYYQGFDKIARKNGNKSFKIYDDTMTKTTLKNSYNNITIIEKIEEMIEHCKSLPMFKSRYINTEIFDTLVQFIDWKEYIAKLKKEAK